MASHLIFQTDCEHAGFDRTHRLADRQDALWCPGPVRRVLDPTRVIIIEDEEFGELDAHITIHRLISALEGS